MAMRPVRGGGVEQNRPIRQQQRPGVPPVHEDFRPVSERHQEEDAEKLLIYLPGFNKENIRVSTEGKNTVRVRVERFVAGNKWNRFQEEFQAPNDCNMRGIHAKFENGILIITMPRKIPTTQTPQPTLPKDDYIPPKTTHNPTIETPRKPTPLKPSAQLPKPATMEKQGINKKILEGQPAETSKGTIQSLKETPLGTTIGGKEEKPRDEKKIIQGSAESSKGTSEALKAAPLGKTSGEDKILEGLAGLIQKGAEEEKLDQKSTQMVKSGKESHGVVTRKDTEKSKELKGEFQEKVEQKGSKEKESTSDVAAGTSSYPAADFSLSNLKKSLTELNEERQLLVNCGAAVLVIMAFGAYVYHSIGSGRAE